jgi:hypothetical protein
MSCLRPKTGGATFLSIDGNLRGKPAEAKSRWCLPLKEAPTLVSVAGLTMFWRGSLDKASRGKRFHRQSARALVRGQSQLAAAFAGRPNGRIAQVVEQLTLNQRVVGSSPTAPTTFRGIG